MKSPPEEAVCADCGKLHARSAMELSFKRPDDVAALSAEQRKTQAMESDDLCAIWPGRFFVRGVLPLQVREWGKPYRIGVWVEVERSVFDRVRELWDAEAQDQEPAFVASLANAIPSCPPTTGLPAMLKLTGPTSRPDVLIPPSDHPLHREQCLGISAHRANEYSSHF
jgi:hypothetical protein